MMNRIFKLCICDEEGSLLASQELENKWVIDYNSEPKDMKILMEDEISEVLSENIRESITPELVLNLIKKKG